MTDALTNAKARLAKLQASQKQKSELAKVKAEIAKLSPKRKK